MGSGPILAWIITQNTWENPQHSCSIAIRPKLEAWLEVLLGDFEEHILEFGREEAQVWGRLRVPHHENALDKQIAATALTNSLKLVTRNVEHFNGLGLEVINPFS